MTRIDRRSAIQLSAKAMVGLMAGLPLLKACAAPQSASEPGSPPGSGAGGTPDAGPIAWGDFLAQVALLAEVQFTPDWNQSAYVTDVQRLMARLKLDDPRLVEAYAQYADEVRNFPEINNIHREAAFEVATLEFEEGESIALHDHPDMTGVILCVSGTVDVENFTLLDESSPSSEFLLQRTALERMRSLDIGTLTANEGNIHSLKALEFTQMLDVFTPPYNEDRSNRSRWFRRGPQPLAGRPDVFEAWLR